MAMQRNIDAATPIRIASSELQKAKEVRWQGSTTKPGRETPQTQFQCGGVDSTMNRAQPERFQNRLAAGLPHPFAEARCVVKRSILHAHYLSKMYFVRDLQQVQVLSCLNEFKPFVRDVAGLPSKTASWNCENETGNLKRQFRSQASQDRLQ